MDISNRPITSIQQVQNEQLNGKKIQPKQNIGTTSFDSILRQHLDQKDQLKFSKHATERLESRQIKLTDEQMLKLQDGVKSASAKGIKESLVLMDDIALVINIENKTVVTALSRQESKEHVFTNIDGAVVI
ncbi:MAG: hypothetical protein PF505_11535 [Vallitaleaceae bacterium]|jgi:flagellar operon protein|nr:hypothetical protein [Vallitaleaceae bacterium]